MKNMTMIYQPIMMNMNMIVRTMRNMIAVTMMKIVMIHTMSIVKMMMIMMMIINFILKLGEKK